MTLKNRDYLDLEIQAEKALAVCKERANMPIEEWVEMIVKGVE
jgi:hypothetical protein